METTGLHERELAEHLGIARDALKKIRGREMEPGTDFELTREGIFYTPAGVERLKSLLKKNGGGPAEAAAENAAQEAASARDGVCVLIVTRLATNRGVLLAVQKNGAAKKTGGEVVVRVRDNRVYRPRLEIHARPTATAGVWAACGRVPAKAGDRVVFPGEEGGVRA